MAINWSTPITPESETKSTRNLNQPKYFFDEIILPQDVREKISDVADNSAGVIQWQLIGRRR